jgi:hypothetical protein
MEKYLTELEIDKIELFFKDEILANAVKKVLLQGIYTHGTIQKGYTPDPLHNGAFSLASLAVSNPIPNEQLGEHIRGMWAGLNALENAWNELSRIKREQDLKESPYNEAI